MIVDTSVAVAMLRGEPEAFLFLEEVERAPRVLMSAASVLELSIVVGRNDPGLIDDFLRQFVIEVIPVDEQQLRWARHGFIHYGRGSGSPAKLNYGDCFSYGAAKALNEPLLFKGNDFMHTDIEPATNHGNDEHLTW